MHKYFLESYILTAIGLVLAYLWSEHVSPGSGFAGVFIAIVLGILEVSLSFDNAVVNALKLEHMSPKWQQRFLTIGILIAVFGMRFLFPLVIVACVAKLNILNVLSVAINNATLYASYLEKTHSSIVAFGGAFLLMLFWSFFMDGKKEVHWLSPIEKPLKKLSVYRDLDILFTIIILFFIHLNINSSQTKLNIIFSGLLGIITFFTIDGITKWLEKKNDERLKKCTDAVKCSGLAGFLYLEMIDASFSFDGVLGAFALSSDIIIIMIGLSIGAIFVRSLTIFLVEKKTLKQYKYLANGAHWAVGGLAICMLASTTYEIPEYVTALIGLVFIISSFVSSMKLNKIEEQSV